MNRLALLVFGVVFASVLLSTPSSRAAVYLVRPDGSGDFPTILAALDASADGDVIELADGVFQGNGNCGFHYLGHQVTVRSVSGNPDDCVIDCEGIPYGVAFQTGEGPAAVLEGVTVRGATASGIRCLDGTAPTLRNCVLLENQADYGAGLLCQGGAPQVEACRFLANQAALAGGGAAVFGAGRTPVFTQCVFETNARGGAGVYQSSRPTFEDCVFRTNARFGLDAADGTTVTVRSCVFVENGPGGRAADLRGTVESVIEDCTFERNDSGLRVDGSAVVSDCRFVENHGVSGSLVANGTSVIVERCTFRGNRTTGAGGGFYGVATLVDCGFFENRAALGGGAYIRSAHLTRCVFAENVADESGGALFVRDGWSARISGCTFYSNDYGPNREDGTGGLDVDLCAIQMDHTIIAFNRQGPSVLCGPNGAIAAECCDVFGNPGGDWTGCLADQGGTNGNISADPLFCGPDEGDYGLRSDSPCAEENYPECGRIGALPVGCSAPTAVRPASWGRIKAEYR